MASCISAEIAPELRANKKLADSSPRSQVGFDHLGISDGRIRANNMGVVFHP
jgi:hypothetical protein